MNCGATSPEKCNTRWISAKSQRIKLLKSIAVEYYKIKANKSKPATSGRYVLINRRSNENTLHELIPRNGGKKSSFWTIAKPRHGYHSAPISQTRYDGRECQMLWKDLGKHPPLFRVGRLQKLFYLPNELVRAMSSDFSEIQTDSGKVYRVFRQILPSDCTWLFRKIGKIRQQRNRSAVYKKVRILCFEDGNNFRDFKFVRENAF